MVTGTEAPLGVDPVDEKILAQDADVMQHDGRNEAA